MVDPPPERRPGKDGPSCQPSAPVQGGTLSWPAAVTNVSLFVRQGLLIFATVAITVLVLTAVSYTVSRAAIREQIGLRLRTATADRAQMLQMYVAQQHERAQLVASRTQLRKLLGERNRGQIEPDDFVQQSQRILADALENTDDFLEIWITDLQGKVVTANNLQRLGDDLALDDDFQRGRERRHLGEPMDRERGYEAQLTCPIRDRDEAMLGVLMIRLSLRSLAELLNIPDGMGNTGEVIVGRRNGEQIQYLFRSPHDDRLTIPWTEAPSLAKAIAGQDGFELAAFGGDSVLVVYGPVDYQPGERPWGMIAKIDAREAYTPINDLRRMLWIVGALLLLPALGAAYTLASHCARPIMRLANSAAALARGDFDARVSVDSQDEFGRLSTAFNDMAERLQSSYDTLERSVQERTAELSRANEELKHSNRDLQEFAYIASHDLQEPLRAVAGFTELLRDDYGDQLDDQAREFIDFTIDGTQRMKLLIDNLLDYSRVETQGLPFQEIDSQQILQQALLNLNEAIEQSNASITDEGLGPIVADGSQLVQVFQNLIGNAIKFRGPAPPQIHVQAQSREGQVQFTICDNGIGIDAQDRQRIFTIFQRLHSRDDYPGTGIGLAICQRIIQRHGGRIWVEAASGQGSCFHFTISQPPGPDASAESSPGENNGR